MSADAERTEEVVDATGHGVGVSVVTQRGAVIGLELLFGDEDAPPPGEG